MKNRPSAVGFPQATTLVIVPRGTTEAPLPKHGDNSSTHRSFAEMLAEFQQRFRACHPEALVLREGSPEMFHAESLPVWLFNQKLSSFGPKTSRAHPKSKT